MSQRIGWKAGQGNRPQIKEDAVRRKQTGNTIWGIPPAIEFSPDRTIRLPNSTQERIARIRRVEFRLRGELGRRPKDEAVAAEVGLPAWQVRVYRHAPTATTSLNAPGGKDEAVSMLDILPDLLASIPGEELIRKTDIQLLNDLLAALKKREQLVLRHRYGLGGREPLTLEQIGRRLNLTRERIRQIEVMAIHKLRKLMASRLSTGFAA